MGFHLKINTVLMGGVNDGEILDFVKFSQENDIEVRFLELMKIGEACGIRKMFMSADDAIAMIKKEYEYLGTPFSEIF